ncbi:MAG: methylated-DNA/protein-cysteinemethyltransferase [Bacteroidetes bacterium]|nr:methylated-DNA/protein-cysteinemethyltransferase [Bacteroidota bacterium]
MRQLPPQSNPSFGFADSPFGECCIVFSSDGICALLFPGSRDVAFYDMEQRFPETDFKQDDTRAMHLAHGIFVKHEIPRLNPIGTEFQQAVWSALEKIPVGETTTYAKIAEDIKRPKAVRAVGTAIGANPIAFLIPCHRVIRSDGGLGGYHWGLEIKTQMLEWELKLGK